MCYGQTREVQVSQKYLCSGELSSNLNTWSSQELQNTREYKQQPTTRSIRGYSNKSSETQNLVWRELRSK